MYGVCLQNAAERWNMNTEIWVITHKKYNEIPDDLYKTIHVGRAILQIWDILVMIQEITYLLRT